MCDMHGTTDSRGRQTVFNPIFKLDCDGHGFSLGLRTIKTSRVLAWTFCETIWVFQKRAKQNAHDALQDVKDTANILIKFLKFQRNISQKTKFEKGVCEWRILRLILMTINDSNDLGFNL